MKKIIIVGATSGIGKSVAKVYINRGLDVGVVGRRIEKVQELVQLAPTHVFPKKIDITQEQSGDDLLSLIHEMNGVDTIFLVSGVGIENKDLIVEHELKTVKTNAEGFTRIIDTAFNYFKNKPDGGHIAAITSFGGIKGLGTFPAYSATKAFEINYISALSQLNSIQHYKIKFTNIMPGFTTTDFLNGRKFPFQMSLEYVTKMVVKCIDKQKRKKIIDWKYAFGVGPIWKLLPEKIWEKMRIQ